MNLLNKVHTATTTFLIVFALGCAPPVDEEDDQASTLAVTITVPDFGPGRFLGSGPITTTYDASGKIIQIDFQIDSQTGFITLEYDDYGYISKETLSDGMGYEEVYEHINDVVNGKLLRTPDFSTETPRAFCK